MPIVKANSLQCGIPSPLIQPDVTCPALFPILRFSTLTRQELLFFPIDEAHSHLGIWVAANPLIHTPEMPSFS